MKRILVLSDSHGNLNNMIFAVKSTAPDLIIHLGDCWGDAGQLKQKFSAIPMERVPGNCDYTGEEEKRVLLIEGKRLMICHGHTYNVKAGYLNLTYGAREANADIVLFGHTHKVYYDTVDGMTIMNPGSIGAPPYGVPPSYGLMEIDEQSGEFNYDVEFLE